MNQDKLREIICKWKFGQRAPDCKSCFSKPECDEVLAQISALDEIDEGKLKIVCEEALNDGLHYLGCVGSRLNDIDREVIKNYLAKALKESNPNDR